MDLSNKQKIVEVQAKSISLSKQTKLLGISRSHFYYNPIVNRQKEAIKQHIQKIFKEIPIYGERKVHQQLLEDGYSVSLNSVSRYRREMGLKAVLAVRPINTTIANTAHSKGRATDNICIERFWRSAKVERIYLNEYDTIQELKDDVRDYMEFYNYKRFHETLEYKKPMSVYREDLEVNSKNYKTLQQIVA